ncbi:MAG TPA: hypothetical protein VMF89_25200, partial [Polyangiales bacterium]|nr:hypothetical protein [Polyangiales bacterium]
ARLPLSAACVLFVLSAARMHRALNVRTEGRIAAQVWEQGLSALLAVLCASMFFGGAFVAGSASAWLLVLSAVLAGTKSVLCYGLLRALSSMKLVSSRRWLWLAMIAVTPLWVRLVPGRSFELIWGSVACVLIGCIALAGLVSSRGVQLEAANAAPARRAKSKGTAPRAQSKQTAATSQADPPRRSQAPRPHRPVPQTQS